MRPVAVGDAEAMVSVLADPSLYQFTGGVPPTREELERRYTSQVRGTSPDGRDIWVNLIVIVDAQPVGYVQATIPGGGDSAEIAWVIGGPWQGRGYARQAAQLLVADLADRGVRQLTALIHPEHVASQRIAAHLGLALTDEMVDGEARWSGAIG